MKLKYSFEKMELDGEIVAVPVGENANELHSILNLNEVAMRILEILHEETSEKDIVSQLLLEYECEEYDVEKAVHTFITQLRQESLLKE